MRDSASLVKSDLQSLQSDFAIRKIGFHFFVVCEIGFRCPAEIRLRAREIRFWDSEIGFFSLPEIRILVSDVRFLWDEIGSQIKNQAKPDFKSSV